MAIAALDPHWYRRAAEYQSRLTMPPGALGRLLELGRQLCAIQQTLAPQSQPAAVVVLAADHGIAEEGVSAYPQEVTSQMLLNFLRGGAAINVLARQQGARVIVADMGIKEPSAIEVSNSDLPPGITRLRETSVARGTANFLREPAMTRPQMLQAMQTGRRIVTECLAPQDVRIAALGEMGIGNTTSASALTAAILGRPAEAVTGRGTGVNNDRWRHKMAVVQQAVTRHFPAGREVSAEDALMALGGFEIAGLVGVALECAARRMLVVLDGFISCVAGLIAARMEPASTGYFVAAHLSMEAGHRAVLESLDLSPLLDLNMRLGEGTGAALALNLIQSAAAILCHMATFESAGVSQGDTRGQESGVKS